MKKIIAILLTIILSFTIIACDDNASTQNKNNKNKSKTTQNEEETSKENTVLNYPKAIYDYFNKKIVWEKVENAEDYYVTIDNKYTVKTTSCEINIGTIPQLTPGLHSVCVKPNNENPKYTLGKEYTNVIRISGFNQEEAEAKVKNEILYTMVVLNIERYNQTLGIKHDKETERADAVICKNNNKTYWVITYSPLLKSGTNYEKTKITVTDYYGNKYDGTVINPTNIKKGHLSVIEFTDKNGTKTLPTVNFADDMTEIKDYMMVSQQIYNNQITIGKTSEVQEITLNGIRTKYDIITTETKNTLAKGNPIFNDKYELIGITIPNTDGKIRFVQIKEILEHIDWNLAEQTHIVDHVNIDWAY